MIPPCCEPGVPRVLVCGPESSGTRTLARVVDAAPVVVWHRSIPHGGRRDHNGNIGGGPAGGPVQRWEPTDVEMQGITHVVAIVRDERATAMSAVRQLFSPSYTLALAARRRAIRLIETRYPRALWVTYEALIRDEVGVRAMLAGYLGVDVPASTTLRDGNRKWGV